MKDLTVHTVSYSSDGDLVMIIGNNKYLFKDVNPHQKKKLSQYIKFNNKRAFFDMIKQFDYEKISSKKRNKTNNNSNKNQQLSLFESIKNIIKEEVNNITKEANVLRHFEDRVNDRLKSDKTYPQFPYEKIEDDIKLLKKIEFPGQYNIGIRLFSSKQPYHYKNIVDGKKEESYGRNVWVVVRANELETLFFMRDGETPKNTQFQISMDYLKDIVNKKGSYELDIEDLKEKPKKKRSRKGDLDLPSVNINNKEWYIDVDNNQLIYSKNIKKKYPLDQAIDNLPEEEAEKILNYV